MKVVTVRLLKPEENHTVIYQAQVVRMTPEYALVRAVWDRPRLTSGM